MKDFQSWHRLKGVLQNASTSRPFIHQREIWFCHLGENVGYEQDGKGLSFLRPVLICRKFNNEIFWGIPLTSTKRQGPYYFLLSFADRQSSAILSQLRLIDAKRLSHKIGTVPSVQFDELTKKLKGLIP